VPCLGPGRQRDLAALCTPREAERVPCRVNISHGDRAMLDPDTFPRIKKPARSAETGNSGTPVIHPRSPSFTAQTSL